MDVNTAAIIKAVDALADKKLPVQIEYSQSVSICLKGDCWTIEVRKGNRDPVELFRKSICSLLMAVAVHVMKRTGNLPNEYVRMADNE